MNQLVTHIQRFCMHDGPGIHTTVFLKGCPLSCFWCHNPETHSEAQQLFFYQSKCIGCGQCGRACPTHAHIFAPEHRLDRQTCIFCGRCVEACPGGALALSGRWMSSREIVDLALRDKAFYGSNGGLTVSGGEPMLHPDRCTDLLHTAKEAGLSTAVETSGYFPGEWVPRLCAVTDTLLWDIKDTDDERHRQNTGVSHRTILDNLYAADRMGVPIILRCVLLKGINLNAAHLSSVKRILHSLDNVVRVDFLPCHELGGAKAASLGMPPRDLSAYVPTREDMAAVAAFDRWTR